MTGYVTVSMQRFDWPRGAVMERGGAEAFNKLLRWRFVFLIITNDSTRLSPLRSAVCACQGPAQRAVSNVFTLCLKMKKCCFNNLCIYLSICLSLAAAHASHQRVSHEEKPEAHRPERHDRGATAGHSQRPALPNWKWVAKKEGEGGTKQSEKHFPQIAEMSKRAYGGKTCSCKLTPTLCSWMWKYFYLWQSRTALVHNVSPWRFTVSYHQRCATVIAALAT